MIPKKIFQTHKSIEYVNSNTELVNAVISWKKNTDYEYHFYDDQQCEDFMKTYYPDIKPYYDILPINVMKADLWRYCIIYKYGGIYADVDTILNSDIDIFTDKKDKQLVIVPENDTHFCQWVFSAPSGSPFLKEIIDLLVERIKTNDIKGEHIIHFLTGPCVFSDGIINHLRKIQRPVTNNYIPYKTYKEELNHNGLNTYKQTRNIFSYEDNKINEIHVFNHSIFHRENVIHLFSGQWEDGWTHQRDKQLNIDDIDILNKSNAYSINYRYFMISIIFIVLLLLLFKFM